MNEQSDINRTMGQLEAGMKHVLSAINTTNGKIDRVDQKVEKVKEDIGSLKKDVGKLEGSMLSRISYSQFIGYMIGLGTILVTAISGTQIILHFVPGVGP